MNEADASYSYPVFGVRRTLIEHWIHTECGPADFAGWCPNDGCFSDNLHLLPFLKMSQNNWVTIIPGLFAGFERVLSYFHSSALFASWSFWSSGVHRCLRYFFGLPSNFPNWGEESLGGFSSFRMSCAFFGLWWRRMEHSSLDLSWCSVSIPSA